MLLEPFQLGKLMLRNRIVMQPIVVNYADTRGFVTERLIDYYTERARGGASLIVVEATCVARGARIMPNQLNIYEDDFIPGLKSLTKAIKVAGSHCFLQLCHGGRMSPAAINDGLQPVAPSAIPAWHYEMPRELSVEEIKEIIGAFAIAARRAREAGFEGIELHFDHGYLPASFASPLSNKRTDKYGGSLEGRGRFGAEVVQGIRRELGEDFPISVRFCGAEELTGGITPKESRKLARMLEEAGATLLNVCGGYAPVSEEGYLNVRVSASPLPMVFARGHFVRFAEGVKQVVKTPVVAAGRLDDLDLAERVLTEGKADLIGIGRGFLADPSLVAKLSEGRFNEVRRCIACNNCLATLRTEPSGIVCTVNAALGKEKEYAIKRAAKIKQVLVVGGGPAGMEAARIARLRGHDVTLIEKKPYLGGTLIVASAPWYKRDIRYVADYLSTQIDRLGVRVLLNTEADEQSILKSGPDVVILALGASPVRPQITGIERDNVTDIIEALEGKTNIGHRVVVVGAGMSGCETAAFLAEKGKEVTLVTRRNSDFAEGQGLAPDMEPQMRKWFIFELLPGLPVEVVANVTFQKVTASGLIVVERDNKERLIEGDTVIFGVGMQPNNGLKAKLEGKVPEIYEVGDCKEPRKIVNAIHEGSRVAYLI